MEQLLIVSQLDLKLVDEATESVVDYDGYGILVEPAEGHVCDRCRAVRPEVGIIEGASDLCHRCHTIVEANFPEYLEQEAAE